MNIDKPSFLMSELPDFLHKVGKGMPRDTPYALLIPMHVQVNMGEARSIVAGLSIAVAARAESQSRAAPKTACSIHEDGLCHCRGVQRGLESTATHQGQHHPTPECRTGRPRTTREVSTSTSDGTICPVKSYSDMTIDINTAQPDAHHMGPFIPAGHPGYDDGHRVLHQAAA